MNKKQLAALVQTMVLSVAATINKNAADQHEPEITEDEARTLLALRLRRLTKTVVADAAGCETDEVVIEQAPVKTRAKATETAETASTTEES